MAFPGSRFSNKWGQVCLIFIFFLFTNITCSVDPLSKITITSNKAVCQKDKSNANIFLFNYIENVNVTFSDMTTVQSDFLNIELYVRNLKENLDLDKTCTNQKDSAFKQFKKIEFRSNVIIKRENRIIHADNAQIFLDSEVCKLCGNVKISQIKKDSKDLPIDTFCKQAVLDLKTEQVTLVGDQYVPVSTTIQFTNYPGLSKKKKRKKKWL